MLQCESAATPAWCGAVCCNALQCVSVCRNVFQWVAVYCNALQCDAVGCRFFAVCICYYPCMVSFISGSNITKGADFLGAT